MFLVMAYLLLLPLLYILFLFATDRYRIHVWKSSNKNVTTGSGFLEGILVLNLLPTIKEYIRYCRIKSLINPDAESLYVLKEFALNLEWALNNPKDILERPVSGNSSFSLWLTNYNLKQNRMRRFFGLYKENRQRPILGKGIAAIGHDSLDDIYTIVDTLTKNYEDDAS